MLKRLNTLILNKFFIPPTHFFIFLLLGTVASASASTITDFTWVSTSAYSASTIVDGIEITLKSNNLPFYFTINTQGSGAMVFDLSSDIDTTITLSFDQTIESLRLYIEDLDTSESLINLSTATTAVDGDLFSSGNSVFSNSNEGDGNLIWNNLYTNSISFEYIRDHAGLGLFLNKLEFVTASTSTVPEPTTMLLFGLGILGIAGVSRKKTA